jgi:DNA-binding NarL/FixJ family response regulator
VNGEVCWFGECHAARVSEDRDVRREESMRAAATRRRQILERLRSGMSRPEVAAELGISKQRLSAILQDVPREEVEAAMAGKVRCPHCRLWVAPHEAGHPRRS